MNLRNHGGRNRQRSQFDLRGRLLLVAAGLGLCSVALIGRAAYVQLINNDFYQREGEARFLREIDCHLARHDHRPQRRAAGRVHRWNRSGATRRSC
jgi:hypothetical protein